MRPLSIALAFLSLATQLTTMSSPALARAPVTNVCGADTYVNSSGHCVPRPRQAPSVPAGASAHCRDGTYSFSEHRQGTCSHHGGVAQWL